MKRILWVLALCALNAIGESRADGQPSAQAVDPGLWRQSIEPGGTDYIWSRKENLPPKGYTLVDFAGNAIALSASTWGAVEDARDGTSLTLPKTIPAGDYSLIMGDQTTAARVSVRLPPERRKTALLSPSAGDDSVQIQTAWNLGSDVVLSPGCYTIVHSLFRPAGASLRGVSRNLVVLTRPFDPNDRSNTFFEGRGGYGGTISDLTIDCTTDPGAIFYHDNAMETNPNFQRLKLISMEIARLNSTGALFEDVETIHCGGQMFAGHTMLHNMSWKGVSAGNMNELILGGDQNALINCNWDLTSRGIILRSGPTNSYFNSLDFERVIQGTNANEVILAEAARTSVGVQNNLFAYVQIHGGRGSPLQLGSTPASNNLFRCFDVDGGEAIWMGSSDVPQAGNVFDSWEMRNVVGVWLGQAKGNTFNNFAIINPRPSHCNEWDWRATTFTPVQSVVRGAAGNRFTRNFCIVGMPDGWNTGLEGIPR